MKPGDVYTRDDGEEYIWNWWETEKYSHLLPVIPTYIGVNPDGYEENPKYQLIKVIYNTRVKHNNPGWYWDITKQNLLDIDREYNKFLQNNLNNNRITDNNRRGYGNIKIDSYSGYSTDDTTTDNTYSWFYDWIKQNQLQRQQYRYMRKNMEKNVNQSIEKIEQDINSAIRGRNDLSQRYNENYSVCYNSINNKNNSNNNLRHNIRANRNNQNNNRRLDNIDLNNMFANHNNNNQIKHSGNHLDNEIDLNNNENEKFNPNCIWDYEYQDLLQAIRKYSKINPDSMEDGYKKQFAQVLKDEGVNAKHWDWWYIDATKFKKINAAYDNMKKGYYELHNKKDNNKKEERKIYANCEVHGLYGGDNRTIAYDLNHRISNQYRKPCNVSSGRSVEGYRMKLYSNNINGLYNNI